MADHDADIGYGTSFYVEDAGSPGAYTKLFKVRAIGPPNAQADDVDVTHMESPGRAREFIQGLTDYGDCTVEMLWAAGSDTDDLIEAWRAAGTTRGCRIVWENGSTWEFDGYVKGYEISAPMDDAQVATLTIKVASSVTRA